MIATYISATQFRVEGDLTAEFLPGRRIKADCSGDGYKYSTIVSRSYSDPYTTVTIEDAELTSNLIDVLYGIVNIGPEGAFPDHTHDGSEGQGGTITFNDLADNEIDFLQLTDTPSSYESGKILETTASGIILVDELSNFLQLTDTPGTYEYQEGKFLQVVSSGIAFSDNSNWLIGSGDPTIGQGQQGDFYLDNASGMVWAKQAWIENSGVPSLTRDIGSSDNGAEGGTLTGTPTDNGTYYTFNGSTDGIYWGGTAESIDERYIDIKIRARFHDINKNANQVLWKSGGSGNAIAVGFNSANFFGVFGRNTSLTQLTIANTSLEENVWYTIYIAKDKVSLINENTGEVIANTGTAVDASNGSANESIGYSDEQSPITGGTIDEDWFDGDIDYVYIFTEGDLDFPVGGGAAWVKVGHIEATYYGTGAPTVSGTEIKVSAKYLDTNTGDMYEYDGADWSKIFDFGDATTSVSGIRINPNIWYDGYGDPPGTEGGIMGDFYIEEATKDLWKRVSGWQEDSGTVTYDRDVGSNDSGLAGGTLYGDPADNGDFYTFSGTGQYIEWDTGMNESAIDIKIRARFHNKTANQVQCIWKVGGSSNGIQIGFNATNDFGAFAQPSGSITVPAAGLKNDTWYIIYISESKIALLEEGTSNVTEQTGTTNPGNGSNLEYIGEEGDGGPLNGSPSNFLGDVDYVKVYAQGDLDFPDFGNPENSQWELIGSVADHSTLSGIGGGDATNVPLVTGAQGIKVEYKSGDEVYLNPGYVHIKDSTYDTYVLDTRISIQNTGLSSSTWYYIYVEESIVGNLLAAGDFSFGSTVPTIDYVNQGYYNGTKRCVGFVLTGGSGDIINYSVDSGRYNYNSDIITSINWQTLSASTSYDFDVHVPLGNITAYMNFYARGNTSANVAMYLGTPGFDLNVIGQSTGNDSDNIYVNNCQSVNCDASGQARILGDNEWVARVWTLGFQMPDYIYGTTNIVDNDFTTVSGVASDFYALELVAEYNISDELLDTTISGVQGDTDTFWQIEFHLADTSDAANAGIRVRLNNDSGSNYTRSYVGQQSGSAVQQAPISLDYIDLAGTIDGDYMAGQAALFLESGKQRVVESVDNRVGSGATYTNIYFSNAWTNTADEVDSIRVYTMSDASGYVKVYRRKAITFPLSSGGSGGTSDVQSFLDLSDTPATYSGTEGQFMVSTGSGIDFISTISVDTDIVANTLVKEWGLTASGIDEIFTWDGETEDVVIEYAFDKDNTVGSIFTVAPNNDTTSANYALSQTGVSTTPATTIAFQDPSTVPGLYVGGTGNTADTQFHGSFKASLKKSPAPRVAYSEYYRSDTSRWLTYQTYWENTVDDVTSIKLSLTGVNDGWVKLYKRAKIALPIYEPEYVDTNIYVNELIAEYKPDTEAFSATISGLAGEDIIVDFSYRLHVTTGGDNFAVRFNNDSATNYNFDYIGRSGGIAEGTQGDDKIPLAYANTTNASNPYAAGTAHFYLGESRKHMTSVTSVGGGGSSAERIRRYQGYWDTLDTDVSSLTLFMDLGQDITGTIKVYKKVNLQLPTVSGTGGGTSDVQSFLDLTDTPTTYSGTDGQFLMSTTSGVDFADAQYADGRMQSIYSYDFIYTISGVSEATVTLDGTTFSGVSEIDVSRTNLIQEFLFEGAGTADTSGNGNNLVFSSASVTTGILKDTQAIQFTTNGEANATNSLSGDASFTVSAYVQIPEQPTTREGVLVLGPQANSGMHWLLDPTSGMVMGEWGVQAVAVPWSYLSHPGRWVHLACTYTTAGAYKAYVDGIFYGQFTGSTFALTGTTVLGEGVTTENSFSGKIDNVRIYNTVLEVEDIVKLAHESSYYGILHRLAADIDDSPDYTATYVDNKVYVKGNASNTYTISTSPSLSYEVIPREISLEIMTNTPPPSASQILRRNADDSGYEWVDSTSVPSEYVADELVKEWNLTSSGINETFTWDSETNEVLYFEVVNANIPAGSNVRMQFNNDTASNYGRAWSTQDGTAHLSSANVNGTEFILSNSYGLESSYHTFWLKNTGQKRVGIGQMGTRRTDDTDRWHTGTISHFWDNTSSDITSVKIWSGSDVTGTFRLYKRGTVQLPAGTVSGTGDVDLSGYVPWDFGAGTISGTGDIYCNDIYTTSGTVYIGGLKLSSDGENLLVDGTVVSGSDGATGATGPAGEDGEDGVGGTVWYDGSGAPSSGLGNANDYYLDNDTGNTYKKDLGTYTSDLFVTPGNASASADDGGPFNAAKAIDNDGGSRWLASTSTDQWWKYDYGTATQINKLTITPQSAYVKDFDVYGSNDDSEWFLLGTFQHGANGNLESFEFLSNDIAYRYLRLDFTYPAWTSSYFSIYEMQSMGATAIDWQLTGGNIKGDTGATGADGADAPNTFAGLIDTPTTYSGTDGQLLTSTGSGIEFSPYSVQSVTTDYEALELVAEYNLTGENLDATISGLSGDTDDEWYITYHLTNAGTANASAKLRLNGDDTNGNYKGTYSGMTTGDAWQGNADYDSDCMGFGQTYLTNTTNSTGFAHVFLKSGRRRVMQTFDGRNNLTTSQNANMWITTSWTNTVDEVTSMTFSTGNPMTGYIKVYKRAKVSLPVYDPNYIDTDLYVNELVAEFTFDNEVMSGTISDIQGDTDNIYYFEGLVTSNTAIANRMGVRFNGDTDGSYDVNYYGVNNGAGSGYSGGVPGETAARFGYTSENNIDCMFHATTNLKSGKDRFMTCTFTRDSQSSYIYNTRWANTADEIITMDLFSEQAVTGYVKVYKKTNIQLPTPGTELHMAKMSRQTSLSLPNGGADSKIPLDTIEFNSHDMADLVGGKIVIMQAGKYYINAKHRHNANFNDQKESWIYLYLNGTEAVSIDIHEASGNGGYVPVEINTVLDLEVGDDLELHMWQNSGGALEVVTPEPPTLTVVQLAEHSGMIGEITPPPAEGNWILVTEINANEENINESIPWNGDKWPRCRIESFTAKMQSEDQLELRFNNDTGSNYSYGYYGQDGASWKGGAGTTYTHMNGMLGNATGGAGDPDRECFTVADLYLVNNSGFFKHGISTHTLYDLDNSDLLGRSFGSVWRNSTSKVTSIDIANAAAGTCTANIKIYRWQDITEAINTTFIGLDDTPTTYSGAVGKVLTATASGISFTSTAAYCKVSDVKSAGTDGGTFTQGAWQTRDLNTVDHDDDNICSLSNNQITLEAGVYTYDITAPGYRCDHHKARLYNTTTSGVVLYGTPAISDAAVKIHGTSIMKGQLTVSGTETFEVQHACQSTRALNGFGNGNSESILGTSPEIYTIVEFWKQGA